MPTHPHPDAERALAQVGYNVLETIGRALGSFAGGIDPYRLGRSLGDAIGGSSAGNPWKGGSRPDVYQN